jgi:hypothetical protein
MNITGYLQKIIICIDQKSFISSLIKMANTVMSAVECGCIGDVKMAHKLRKVALWGS